MSRLIDADKLKQHYAWWENGTAEMTLDEAKRNFDTIIDVQPTVDIDAITESHEKIGYDKGFRDGYAQATVETVPTEFHDKCMEIEIEKRFELELKEKHGHWRKSYISAWHSSDDNDHLYLYCSVCGERIELQGAPAEKMEEEGKLYKYCPWCGAKMDEDKGTIDIGNGFSITANGAKMDGERKEDAKTD